MCVVCAWMCGWACGCVGGCGVCMCMCEVCENRCGRWSVSAGSVCGERDVGECRHMCMYVGVRVYMWNTYKLRPQLLFQKQKPLIVC